MEALPPLRPPTTSTPATAHIPSIAPTTTLICYCFFSISFAATGHLFLSISEELCHFNILILGFRVFRPFLKTLKLKENSDVSCSSEQVCESTRTEAVFYRMSWWELIYENQIWNDCQPLVNIASWWPKPFRLKVLNRYSKYPSWICGNLKKKC